MALLRLYPGDEGPGAWFEQWIGLSPDCAAMDSVNPVYIPRNHLVDEALEAANDGNFELFDRLLEALKDPFTVRPGFERYGEGPPRGSHPHRTYCGT